jgi:hypothetical protein
LLLGLIHPGVRGLEQPDETLDGALLLLGDNVALSYESLRSLIFFVDFAVPMWVL